MTASVQDLRAGIVIGWFLGTLLVGCLWVSATQARADRAARQRQAQLDALARINTRIGGPR